MAGAASTWVGPQGGAPELETEELAREAEAAKVRTSALFYVMTYLKSGQATPDIPSTDMN